MRCNEKSMKECLSEKGNKKESLQAEKMSVSPLHSFFTGTRKVFLWILKKSTRGHQRASLTVEAAVVLPVFLLTVASILGILDIYRIQSLLKVSLHQSAMELGMYAYAGQNGLDSPVGGAISSGLCIAYAKRNLPDFEENIKVSLGRTSCRGDVIVLKAEMIYKLPVSVVPLPALRFTNEVIVNSWVGWDVSRKTSGGEIQWEEMVYVSETESVYHTSPTCTHIDLSIHAGREGDVKKLRNEYGEKYHSCEKCGNHSDSGTVYYTEKGNCYHTSEGCSGLKRTVRLVKKSDLPGLHQCQRCGGKEHS